MLQNLDWTKATVNGKKAALVVYNDFMYLLSYVPAWDMPTDPNYEAVPKHGFFKKICLSTVATASMGCTANSFAVWRNWYLSAERELGIRTIALPGEDGFERNIRRRNTNRNAENAAEPTNAEPEVLESQNDGSIDFYLPNYTTNNIYQGMHGYHNSHSSGFMNQPRREYRGHRIGVELEVEANNEDLFNEIVAKKSNWFTRERDGSLASYGIEFITVPLLPEDAKSYQTWQPLCQYLKNKAKSWNTGRCGLHVHIGREILGDTEVESQMTLGKLLIFYQGDVENWIKATAVFGRDRCYNQPSGETEEIKAVRCLGKGVLKDAEAFSKVDRAMKTKFGSNRYYAVNLTNAHTIEFRKGRGSINADRIIAIVTMTEAICLFCRHTEAHELTLENFQQFLFHNVPCGNPVFRYLDITQPDA